MKVSRSRSRRAGVKKEDKKAKGVVVGVGGVRKREEKQVKERG